MKKLLTLFLMLSCVWATQTTAQERYLDDMFTDITVTSDINYATNITVITVSDTMINAPTPQALTLDFYEPTGDTETARPLVLVFHTGNFLPQGTNGSPSGLKTDFPVVEVCTRLAQKGYAVASVDYRQGWNPISMNINERIGTLLNAAYRGIQDANSCVRFFRKDADTDNNYSIDPNRITFWGIGTGGYISTAAAAIDSYQELVLPKFIDSDTGIPFVLEQVSGDPQGLVEAPINIPNHPGYNSKVQLAVNMGGAIGDTSWIKPNSPPYINYQCPNDPFAPYMEDILIVPTTGDLIVEVQGAYTISAKAKATGSNAVWDGFVFDMADAVNVAPTPQMMAATPYTRAAEVLNDGLEGLFPLDRPCPVSIFTGEGSFCEASPWDWWDAGFWSQIPHPSCPVGAPIEACNFHAIGLLNNNDASEAKGKIYIDSIMGHFAPRACVALDLPCAQAFADVVSVEEVLDAQMTVIPNPAESRVTFTTEAEMPIETIELYSVSGSLVKTINNVQSNQYQLDRDNIPTGMYVAKVRVAEGVITRKIMFK